MHTRKLLELINEFSKVAVYKINIWKFVAFLYTNNEISEREIKKTIIFNITSKRIKYVGMNVLKEVKGLYSENSKMLTKEIEDNTNRWKDKGNTPTFLVRCKLVQPLWRTVWRFL